MKRLTITTIALSTVFTAIAFAEDIKNCDVKSFVAVLAEMDNATAEGKELVITELKMAKDKMIADDAEACAIHLTNASNAATAQ